MSGLTPRLFKSSPPDFGSILARKEGARGRDAVARYAMGFAYGPSAAVATESVFRAVELNGAFYNYYYDAQGKRRLKSYPGGTSDEYFHDLQSQLLVDRGSSGVVTPVAHYTQDDYVWLGGRPVALVRGKLSNTWARLSDSSADCTRNGEAAACGVYFPVTDHIGKPVLMLDGSRRVAGAADYEPFGHVNRVALNVEAQYATSAQPETYPLVTIPQSMDASMTVKTRVLFHLVEVWQGGVELRDGEDEFSSTVLTSVPGTTRSRFWSDWVQSTTGSVNVWVSNFSPADDAVVLESYEYQLYQTGAQPFWTPLRFPGQYHDAETDLFENWNRYYDPSIGRYLQPEPMLQEPGYLVEMALKGYGVLAYAYAANNPLYFVDPTGLAFDEFCWAKCIEEVNPLENNPLFGDEPPREDQCSSDSRFPWGTTAALGTGALPKVFGWRPGASHFTSIWRYMNIGSRSAFGRPVFSGPTTKTLGRGSVYWTIGAGLTSWGVIGACAVECSGR